MHECKNASEGLQCPICVRWVDTDQGTSDSPNVRFWFVARDFHCGKVDDAFYAPMPTLEAKKALFAMIARKFGEWRRGEAKHLWQHVHRRQAGAA